MGIMNEPLLSKHGAASLLGITKAALMNLVRAEQVPYVKLPGKGEVRFDGSDLQKWVNQHKGGDMPATAEKTERQRMQEQLRKRPEFLEKRKQAVEKLKALQVKVDAGEITERALERPKHHVEHLCGIIANIDNKFRTDLINNCPCEDLRDEWEEFNEQGKVVYRELTHAKQTLKREKESLFFKEKEIKSLTNPGNVATDEFQPFWYGPEYQSRIDLAKREYKKLKKEITRLEARVVELTEQIEVIQAEKARVREEMIYYGEDQV